MNIIWQTMAFLVSTFMVCIKDRIYTKGSENHDANAICPIFGASSEEYPICERKCELLYMKMELECRLGARTHAQSYQHTLTLSNILLSPGYPLQQLLA